MAKLERHSVGKSRFQRFLEEKGIFLIALILGLTGLVAILVPWAIKGSGLGEFPDPIAGVCQDVGVALCIAGTVSFFIEELIKKRTRDEFRMQLNNLLSETGEQMTSQVTQSIKVYVSEVIKHK